MSAVHDVRVLVKPSRMLWRKLCVMGLLSILPITNAAGANRPGTPVLSPADLVNPFVGTAGDHGQLHPGAVLPFGMVHLGPETNPAGHSGYDFLATDLIGFSHNRANGVGCSGAGGNLLISARFADAPGPRALMDKSTEVALPGYYQVSYDGGSITSRMAASDQAGLLRFEFSRSGEVKLRVDAGHGRPNMYGARLITTENKRLEGTFTTGTVCDQGRYSAYFSTTLDRGPGAELLSTNFSGQTAEYVLRVQSGSHVELRSGLSVVDVDSARRVRSHLDETSIGTLSKQAHIRWNEELSRVQLYELSDRTKLFYTNLYIALQTPYRISGPSGNYRGSDGTVRRAPEFQRYTGWAMWDNYRTQMPLLALIAPERAQDIARSLTELFGEGKRLWAMSSEPYITVRTEHAGIALLDFHRKGIRFNAGEALRGMATESPHLPRDTPDQKIETAYDDWAAAELATELGDDALAKQFRQKSHSYRPYWLDLLKTITNEFDVVGARGLYQGTLWQYRWAPVFDLEFLLGQLTPARFNTELAYFFEHDLYNITNQPSIHTPYLFCLTGEPWRAQDIVDRLLTRPVPHHYTNSERRTSPLLEPAFALQPEGFADGMDDDFGGMSSWYVWSSLGLYPVVPGMPVYALVAPQQERASIHVGDGRRLEILRIGRAEDRYIQAVTLNGQNITRAWLLHQEISGGGMLEIKVGARPPADWGRQIFSPYINNRGR